MLTQQLDEKSIIEILGLESLTVEEQAKFIDTASEVVDLRCLERILDALSGHEKSKFAKMLEDKDARGVRHLFQTKNIDILDIVEQELLRFKRECAELIDG